MTGGVAIENQTGRGFDAAPGQEENENDCRNEIESERRVHAH